MARLSKPNIDVKDRLLSVDAIRGVAILGCALTTSLKLLEMDSSSFFVSVYRKSLDAFFFGTFYPLLAVMFGVSAALYFSRHRDGDWVFARKLLWLALFGMVDVLLVSEKVLLGFLVGGAIVLFLRKTPHRIHLGLLLLFGISVVLSLGVMLFRDFTSPFANFFASPIIFLVVFGFYSYEKGFAARVLRDQIAARKLSRFLIGISIFLSVLSNSFVITKPLLLSFQGIAFGFFIASVVAVICHVDHAQFVVRNVAMIGRMPFTIYGGFMILLTILSNGYRLTLLWHALIMVGMVLVAVFFCRAWFSYFQYGPLEWVIRTFIARGEPVPFHRHKTVTDIYESQY